MPNIYSSKHVIERMNARVSDKHVSSYLHTSGSVLPSIEKCYLPSWIYSLSPSSSSCYFMKHPWILILLPSEVSFFFIQASTIPCTIIFWTCPVLVSAIIISLAVCTTLFSVDDNLLKDRAHVHSFFSVLLSTYHCAMHLTEFSTWLNNYMYFRPLSSRLSGEIMKCGTRGKKMKVWNLVLLPVAV